MRVIGFNASPRKSGSTAWSITQILESATEAGAETQIFHSGGLTISPCRGCLGCAKGDGCVVADDMRAVYASLKQADALVLGSPLYMAQMSGQAKVFTDRLFAQITPRFSPRFKEENAGKKLILVFTQGNPDQSKFQAYYDYTRNMFQMLEFDVQDMIVVTGTRSEQASRNVGLSDVLRKAGQKLAQTFPSGGIGMATAIDEYIDEQNTEVQPLLRNICDTIRNAAPGATEKISYRMPTFWRGENIIHFAAFKHHIGIYPGGEAVGVFFKRLMGYKTSKGAIQLPIDKPIDYELITDIMRWRMEQIERKQEG